MAEVTLIPAQTAAATVTIDARSYDRVVLKCSTLGAAETIAINVLTGGAFVPVGNYLGATNPVVTFTGSGGTPADLRQVSLEGDMYQIVKGVTAGAVGVYANPKRDIAS